MASTKEDILGWIVKGRRGNHSHMLVVTDTFDNSDYPVYISANSRASVEAAEDYYKSRSMSEVTEIYWIVPEADVLKQVNRYRCFEYGPEVE